MVFGYNVLYLDYLNLDRHWKCSFKWPIAVKHQPASLGRDLIVTFLANFVLYDSVRHSPNKELNNTLFSSNHHTFCSLWCHWRASSNSFPQQRRQRHREEKTSCYPRWIGTRTSGSQASHSCLIHSHNCQPGYYVLKSDAVWWVTTITYTTRDQLHDTKPVTLHFAPWIWLIS